MKMELNGWARSVTTHRPTVLPVDRASRGIGGKKLKPGPIRWHAPLKASAHLKGLSLSGDFLLDMTFEEAELRNWLLAYAKGLPDQALRLISEVQAEAIIALQTKPEEA
ncbi:hypothetical protein GOM96_00055 [Stutzerimonas degradans]|nr:hypothetical protein FEV13_03535 [Stutzerimonas degradans]QGW19450.1 hypothetical protein GOM96_00055 [Stutzerimonas degradans]